MSDAPATGFTDFHSHLMEFDLPDSEGWHTVSMTTTKNVAATVRKEQTTSDVRDRARRLVSIPNIAACMWPVGCDPFRDTHSHRITGLRGRHPDRIRGVD